MRWVRETIVAMENQ